jgi:hypothetical protein
MEMEVDRSKIKEQDLYEFVSNLAPDLFQNGHVIADENRVGGGDDERILFRSRPSMVGQEHLLSKILFEG